MLNVKAINDPPTSKETLNQKNKEDAKIFCLQDTNL